eukprot:1145397-Pelagomonas_calceolata.AAC.1
MPAALHSGEARTFTGRCWKEDEAKFCAGQTRAAKGLRSKNTQVALHSGKVPLLTGSHHLPAARARYDFSSSLGSPQHSTQARRNSLPGVGSLEPLPKALVKNHALSTPLKQGTTLCLARLFADDMHQEQKAVHQKAIKSFLACKTPHRPCLTQARLKSLLAKPWLSN